MKTNITMNEYNIASTVLLINLGVSDSNEVSYAECVKSITKEAAQTFGYLTANGL